MFSLFKKKAASASEDGVDTAKELRKRLDYRLLPWVTLGYVVNGLDRNNLPNAYVLGMDVDLELNKDKGRPQADAQLYFFITYVSFQVVMNAFFPRVRPSIVLPIMMLSWGLVAAAMALSQVDYHLFILRAALGICEAGYYPGVIYLLGTWYTKDELALRITIFSLGGQLGSALSGTISASLATFWTGGLAVWRMMFVVEGLISVVLAIPGFWILPDYPSNTRWLAQDMKDLAVKRLENQGNQVKFSGYSWAVVKNILISPYFYLFLVVIPIANWLPGIIGTFIYALVKLDFDPISANWQTVPVYIFAAITLPIIGYSSDRWNDRFFHSLFCVTWAIFIYGILMVSNFNPPVWLLFLCVYILSPMQTLYPLVMSWVNELWSVDNQTRALSIAFFNAAGNIVINFLARYIWLAEDAPQFFLGKSTVLGGMIFLFFILTAIRFLQYKKILMPVDKDGKTSTDLIKEREEEIYVVADEKPKIQEKPRATEEGTEAQI